MRLLPTTLLRNPARRALLAALVPVVAGLTARAAAAAPPNPIDIAADAALADRIESLASVTFPAQVPSGDDRPFIFEQQAALFAAASALDPASPRYLRKRAEALADADAPLAEQEQAVSAILPIDPGDEFTWLKLLDLHVGEFQAADKQINYLKGIEASPAVPRNVAAYAGARHAAILVDQGKEQAARTLLKWVLSVNPLNPDALRLQYRLLPATATPFDRETALLNLLKANPLQPTYALQAAKIAADAGLVQDAITFYALGVNTSVGLRRPDLQGALDWAAELYVANQNNDAYRFTQNLLASNPNSAEGWYLRLLIARSSGIPQPQQDRDLQTATIVLSNRLAELINATIDLDKSGATTQPGAAAPAARSRATTRPYDAEGSFPLPDVGPTADFLKTDPPQVPPQLKREFINAVADLARLEIYFAKRPPAAAPLLAALGQLLPPGDPLLAQLQGLNSFVSGDFKAALTTLAGVAKDDPIAAMGLILAQQKDNPAPDNLQQTEIEARKLIQDHPDGLIGAFLIEALSNDRVRLMQKNGTQPLKQLLLSFPSDLMNLGASPNRLYSIHLEPVDQGRAWGQPLLVRVTLFNFSPVDLTIGDRGAIHPDLLFQVTPVIGAQPANFQAFDTLAGPMVLRPRSPLTQIVRVDQAGGLIALLDQNVKTAFQIDGQVATNPDIRAGGFVQRSLTPFARTAVNEQAVADAVGQINAVGAGGSTPAQRLTAVGVLQAYVREMRNTRGLPPAVVTNVANVANTVHRARGDGSPAAAAWAAQADFALSDANGRATILTDMAANDNWRQRLLAAVLVQVTRDVGLEHRILDPLRADAQSPVADYAKASVSLLDLPKAAAAPTSQPATPPDAGAEQPLLH